MFQLTIQQARPFLEPRRQANANQVEDLQMADFAREGSLHSVVDELVGGASSTDYPQDNATRSEDAESTLALQYHARNRPSLLTRLGTFTVITNALTFTALAISISIISWLWLGDEKDDRRRKVLLGDRLDEIITTSSIFVRAAVATQTTTVIAMLSSLALERGGGVRLKEVPAISLARYSNTGPLSSLIPIFWNTSARMFAIVILVAYTSIASQFTSTLLLRDLQVNPITSFPQYISTAVGFGFDTWVQHNMSVLCNQGRNYWAASPFQFHSFAEWAKKPQEALISSVKDTGPNLRAFLPITSAQDRASLKAYEGVGDVFDTRVFCSRPVIKFDETSELGKFSGTLSHGNLTKEIEEILRLPDNRTSIFNFDTNNLGPGSFLFVQLDTTAGGLVNSLDPLVTSKPTDKLYYKTANWFLRSNDTTYEAITLHEPRIELGHTFLFIARQSYSTDELFEHDSVLKYSVLQIRPNSAVENGVWQEYPRNDTDDSGGFNITVCYDALFSRTQVVSARVKHHQSFNIRGSRDVITSEPTVKWDSKTKRFDTTDISRLYIPTPRSHHTFKLERQHIDSRINDLRHLLIRGVTLAFPAVFGFGDIIWWYYNTSIGLNPDYPYEINPDLLKVESYDFIHGSLWTPFLRPIGDDTGQNRGAFEILAACQQCTLNNEFSQFYGFDNSTDRTRVNLHPVLSSIVRDVFEAVDHDPAATWQALLTSVLGSAYYDWLPAFSRNETAMITTVVERAQPLHHGGYAIVISTVVLQLTISVIILVLFSRFTCYSILDNAWQAVSQVVSTETMSLIVESTTALDKDVKAPVNDSEVLGTHGEGKGDTQLLMLKENNGRVCVQR